MMQNVVRSTRWIVRIAGLVQIVLGVLFWTRHALAWIPVHMLVGLVLVLGLWALAGFALRAGMSIALVTGAFALGGLLPWLGVVQAGMLVGQYHWVIQVVHLLLGLGAIRVAEVLAAGLLRPSQPGAAARAA